MKRLFSLSFVAMECGSFIAIKHDVHSIDMYEVT